MKPQKALPLLLGITLVDMICQGMVYPALPSLVAELEGTTVQGSTARYGVILAAYAIAELFGAPALGLLSDRFGRRPVLVVSCFLAALSFLVGAFASHSGMILAGYFLAGLTSAIMVVVNASMIDQMEPSERSRGFSLLGAAVGLGLVLGPVTGALIAPLGLRAPFWGAAGLMVLGGIVLAFFLPETRRLSAEPAVADWRDFLPWRALSVLFRTPVLRRLSITVASGALALQLLIGIWVPFVTIKFGLGIAENGWLLAGYGVVQAAAAAFLVPVLLKRLGDRRGMVIGLVASVLAYVSYAFAPNVWFMLLSFLIFTPAALDEPSIPAILSNEIGEEEQGALQGALGAMRSLAAIVGPLVGTAVLAQAVSVGGKEWVGAPHLLCGFLALVGLVAALSVVRKIPNPA